MSAAILRDTLIYAEKKAKKIKWVFSGKIEKNEKLGYSKTKTTIIGVVMVVVVEDIRAIQAE